MNEGKQKLEAMRKKLKKRGDNIETNDKATKEPQSLQIFNQETFDSKKKKNLGNQIEHFEPNHDKYKKNKIEIVNQPELIDFSSKFEKKNNDQTFVYPQNHVQSKVIRQQGEIEEDEEDQENEGPKKNDNIDKNEGQKIQLNNLVNQDCYFEKFGDDNLLRDGDQQNKFQQKECEDISNNNCDLNIDESRNRGQRQNNHHIQQQIENNLNPLQNLKQKNQLIQKQIDVNTNDLQLCNNLRPKNEKTFDHNEEAFLLEPINLTKEAQSLNENPPKVDLYSNATQSQPNSSFSTLKNTKQVGQVTFNTSSQSLNQTTKIVLKELKIIKSSIHNLNITYRGLEYLRQQIKQNSLLKRRIRERLESYSENNTCDILRKLVKKINLAESSENISSINFQKQALIQKHSMIGSIFFQVQKEGEKSTANQKKNISNEESILVSKEFIEG